MAHPIKAEPVYVCHICMVCIILEYQINIMVSWGYDIIIHFICVNNNILAPVCACRRSLKGQKHFLGIILLIQIYLYIAACIPLLSGIAEIKGTNRPFKLHILVHGPGALLHAADVIPIVYNVIVLVGEMFCFHPLMGATDAFHFRNRLPQLFVSLLYLSLCRFRIIRYHPCGSNPVNQKIPYIGLHVILFFQQIQCFCNQSLQFCLGVLRSQELNFCQAGAACHLNLIEGICVIAVYCKRPGVTCPLE